MKQIAIIGLGTFGIRMLEELTVFVSEIIIIDRDAEIIEKYKDMAKDAFVTDAINEEALQKIIPQDIDCVIVDVGGKIEASIMTTNYLHKMGVKNIIVKAETDEHGEVLKMVGATTVVFPDLEAAKHVTPLLISNALFNFMSISQNMSLAEIRASPEVIGKTLIEANIRQRYDLNVVAYREGLDEEFKFPNDPSYRFSENNVLLVAGTNEAILKFSGSELASKYGTTLKSVLSKLFSWQRK
ncbi:MAG: TrkA family potassium uptake protein [Spirochaetaceae bacterium]|jgi:trk system potassium uptake protein TrkA|nr:TrkA family potassium uptake protein [Spirochaetaceae bacterium]